MIKKLNTPILLLVFNRPDTTEIVFNKIREMKPPRLYVAADGPRVEKQGESKRCEQVREIVTKVDWDCELKTLFRNENLGCKIAVSQGIDWFFNQEEMGIILEDDCLPNDSFFKFCEELLHRYKDEERVMTISGNNYQPKRRTKNSYYFSKYMYCWGWASWNSSWKAFDLNMKKWEKDKESNFLEKTLKYKKAVKYWKRIFERVYAGEIDSWAYIWTYSIFEKNGLNIIPEENLVSNIGFGNNATHTKNEKVDEKYVKTKNLKFPLQHPSDITIHEKADKFTQYNHFQTPLYKRILNKIKRALG